MRSLDRTKEASEGTGRRRGKLCRHHDQLWMIGLSGGHVARKEYEAFAGRMLLRRSICQDMILQENLEKSRKSENDVGSI